MDHRAGTARGLSWPRGPGAGLEGDQAIVPEIARQIDGGHPAPAQLALEEVAVAESVPELACDVGHGCGLKWRPFESVPTDFELLAERAGAPSTLDAFAVFFAEFGWPVAAGAGHWHFPELSLYPPDT
jgi:hypothetical protein